MGGLACGGGPCSAAGCAPPCLHGLAACTAGSQPQGAAAAPADSDSINLTPRGCDLRAHSVPAPGGCPVSASSSAPLVPGPWSLAPGSLSLHIPPCTSMHIPPCTSMHVPACTSLHVPACPCTCASPSPPTQPPPSPLAPGPAQGSKALMQRAYEKAEEGLKAKEAAQAAPVRGQGRRLHLPASAVCVYTHVWCCRASSKGPACRWFAGMLPCPNSRAGERLSVVTDTRGS